LIAVWVPAPAKRTRRNNALKERTMARTPAVLLLLLLVGTLAGGIVPRVQAAQTATLLSGPDAGAFEATLDGAFVTLNRSQSSGGAAQVFSVPIGSGTSTPLSPPGASASLLTTSNDSKSVVYLVNGNTPSAGVFLAPVGGGESVKLNAPVSQPNIFPIAYASPNRRYVVYHVGPDYNTASEIYSIALDTRTVARLTPPVPVGETIRPRFITPDSRYVVFWVGTDTRATYYAAPLAGGEPVRLYGPVAPDYSGPPYTTADSRAIFIRQQRSANITTISVVPIDGGPPRELVPGLAPNTTIELFAASADGKWAIVKMTTNPYVAGFTYTLASVPLDGSGAPVELTSGSAQTGSIGRISISDDGQWAVYAMQLAGSGRYALYSVPTSGGTPVLLNVPPENGGPSVNNTLYISPDSRRVVFFGSDQGQERMYSVPIAGGSAPIPIDGPLPQGGGIEQSFLQFTPDGRFVLYRGEGSIASYEFHYDLFATPIDGSGPARMLNNPALFVAGYPYNQDHYYPDFLALPDSRHALFRAGPYQSGISCSLYLAELAASGGITIQRLVRGDVPAGSDGFALAIDGANFVPGTSVEWNGQIRPATFVNDQRITVLIAAADLAVAGSISVRALTPSNDRSNVVYFFVTQTGQLLTNTSVYLPLTQR
jgi:Tol biopolymer transport system component